MSAATPIRDYVLVRGAEVANTSAGGIVLPDEALDRPVSGKVVAVGSGHLTTDGQTVALEVLEGDTVHFQKGRGFEIEINDEKLIALREIEIIVYER